MTLNGAKVLGVDKELGSVEAGKIADLVVILLLANAVQNALVGPDNSLSGGLIAALVLLSANWTLNRLALRSARVQRLIIGQPVILINHGEFLDANLRHEGLTREQVMAAMREHGVSRAEDVELAVLEVDGAISFVTAGEGMQRTRKSVRGRKPAA